MTPDLASRALPGKSITVVHRAWPLTVIVLASMLVAAVTVILLLVTHATVAAILAATGASFATSVGIGFAIVHFMNE